ncbi:hypothetical protein [uncultured Albimonas sp.]
MPGLDPVGNLGRRLGQRQGARSAGVNSSEVSQLQTCAIFSAEAPRRSAT